jgi:predicted NBD/HSP70 family sugar kinase
MTDPETLSGVLSEEQFKAHLRGLVHSGRDGILRDIGDLTDRLWAHDEALRAALREARDNAAAWKEEAKKADTAAGTFFKELAQALETIATTEARAERAEAALERVRTAAEQVVRFAQEANATIDRITNPLEQKTQNAITVLADALASQGCASSATDRKENGMDVIDALKDKLVEARMALLRERLERYSRVVHAAQAFVAVEQEGGGDAEWWIELEEAVTALASPSGLIGRHLDDEGPRWFHLRDGWYFHRNEQDDGTVTIHIPGRTLVIPANEWESVVAAMSPTGDNADTYAKAKALHEGEATPEGVTDGP